MELFDLDLDFVLDFVLGWLEGGEESRGAWGAGLGVGWRGGETSEVEDETARAFFDLKVGERSETWLRWRHTLTSSSSYEPVRRRCSLRP